MSLVAASTSLVASANAFSYSSQTAEEDEPEPPPHADRDRAANKAANKADVFHMSLAFFFRV